MEQRILIVADSALELLMSIHVKLSLYREIPSTLIMTDRTAGAYGVYKRLAALNVFEKVIYVEATKFPELKVFNRLPGRIRRRFYDKVCILKAREILKEPDTYTTFLTSEIDFFSRYMYLAVKKTADPYLIGEGIFTFGGLKENIARQMIGSSGEFLKDLKGVLYYGPQFGEFPLPKATRIPSVNENRKELVDILNEIYGYEPHSVIYQNKIIVFEESYANDGGSDDLMGFLAKLVKKFGNENVLVKRHPRDRENRFADMQIASVEPFHLPWELFILNGDCRDCVLLAANSGSVYLCQLWDFCKEEVKSIMLNHLLEYKHAGGAVLDRYYTFLEGLYRQENICSPETEAELFHYIENAIEGWETSHE